LLAELSFLVLDAVVVVRGVALVLLGSELVGNGTAILGVEVLMALWLALGIAGTLLELGDGDVALVTGFIDGTVSDGGLA
jgi:hypothetical protein